MKIVAFTDISTQAWDEVVEGSREAWFFHRACWVLIESAFGAERNLSFGIQDDAGRLAAIHPLYLHRVPLGAFAESLLDSGIHRQTGLATLDTLSGAGRDAIRRAAMQHVFGLAKEVEADRIQLNAHNLAQVNCGPEREEIPYWVLEDGFELGLHFRENGFVPVPGMATCCADQIVPLEQRQEEEVFQGLEKACQRAVRKALRHGLTASFESGEEAVSEYYRLAKASASRTGETLLPVEFYRSILEAFSAERQAGILFTQSAGKAIGALFLITDKGSVNFLAGVSDPEFLPLRVNDFLHWSAIQWALAGGYARYRLGPILPTVPENWPVSMVSRFKKKFGGRSVPILQGSYFCQPGKYAKLVTWLP